MNYKPEHHEATAPFLLTADARTPTKSKDEIVVEVDENWSALRSGRADRPIYVYVAKNLTKNGGYTVELFEDDEGRPWAHCNCAALPTVCCKHQKAALEDLLQRVPEFGGDTFKPQTVNTEESVNAETTNN